MLHDDSCPPGRRPAPARDWSLGRVRRRRSERRARGDRGTALIESAFVFPVVIILVFGIVEIGFLFRSASLVTGSTRAGARIASAQYGSAYVPGNAAASTSAERIVADSAAGAVAAELLSDGITDTPQTLWVFKADASGNPAPADCSTDCFKYTWNSGTKAWTYQSGAWAVPDACGQTLDYLAVRVILNHQALVAPQMLSLNTIDKKTVMRLESRQGCTTPEGP
jgi:Flp pilus assembly protein TadG